MLDLALADPVEQLRGLLAKLDALGAADQGRQALIAPALCHLQHAIDLLDQAQVTYAELVIAGYDAV